MSHRRTSSSTVRGFRPVPPTHLGHSETRSVLSDLPTSRGHSTGRREGGPEDSRRRYSGTWSRTGGTWRRSGWSRVFVSRWSSGPLRVRGQPHPPHVLPVPLGLQNILSLGHIDLRKPKDPVVLETLQGIFTEFEVRCRTHVGPGEVPVTLNEEESENSQEV